MDNREIGMRIRAQRELLGYTREEFAELINVTPKFCSDIELGHRGMSIQTLCNICNALHISSDYILFGQSVANTTDELDSLMAQLQSCDKGTLSYANDLLTIFLQATHYKK